MPPKRDPLTYALFLLSRRGRTKMEVHQKMMEKGYSEAEIQTAITQLTEMRLLDDRTYAKNYVRDKIAIYRRGGFRIGLELYKKGVSKEIIDEALQEVAPEDELEAAKSLLKGRERQWQDLTERKRFERSVTLLQRRGFSGKIIRQAMDWIKEHFDTKNPTSS